MSDIFKRIKSIEADDSDALDALGLPPADDDTAPKSDAAQKPTDENISSAKPLNLTVPVDDAGEPIDLDESDTTTSDSETAPPPRIRPLGLTPVVPLASSKTKNQDDNALKPITAPIPKPPKPDLDSQTKKPTPVEKAAAPSPTAPQKTEKDTVPAFVTREAVGSIEDIATTPRFGHIMIIGVIAAIIWTLCAIGFTLWGQGGLKGLQAMSALKLAGFATLIIVPMLLFIFCAYALRELSKLAVHSDRLSKAAQAMMSPDETVITRSTIMSKAVQAQIEAVNLKVSSAMTRMELLDDVVKSQSASLSQSTLSAENVTDKIASTLTAQREALDAVANTFESRMAGLSVTLDSHAENLSQSTQTAEQKIQEARVSIEGAAEKINSASDVVRQNAVAAAETLSGSQTEITMLGNAINTRSEEMDAVYRKHVTDLTAMIDHLKKEQDEMGAILEERLTKMRDMSMSAKVGAQSLSDASDSGRATVEALADAARLTDTAVRARFKEMEDMVKYSTARAESISDTAARQVQNSLSTTRKEIARIEADMMDLMDKLGRSQNAQNIVEPSAANNTLAQQKEALGFNTDDPPKPRRVTLRPLDSDFPSLEPGLPAESIEEQDTTYAAPVEPDTLFRLETMPAPPPVALPDDLDDAPIYDDTQLSFEPIEDGDLTPPDADAPLTSFDPDIVRSAIEDNDASSKKESSSKWRWRGLFGAPEKSNASGQSAAKDIVKAAKKAETPHPIKDITIVKALSNMGLSPAAIVDDGCIIEAANIRKSKTADAMSAAVAKRMATPVRHLREAAINDAGFKSDLTRFTNQFRTRLDPISTDREAIRETLESDAGRAFLLCDAALNG
ncbi:hypothetical protein [Fretibacter rubidus]|uniref:hypothetical protein n=1 Tax=Fretibacter rubidus TaxID=570162 RepID=UPI00352AB331